MKTNLIVINWVLSLAMLCSLHTEDGFIALILVSWFVLSSYILKRNYPKVHRKILKFENRYQMIYGIIIGLFVGYAVSIILACKSAKEVDPNDETFLK